MITGSSLTLELLPLSKQDDELECDCAKELTQPKGVVTNRAHRWSFNANRLGPTYQMDSAL